MEFWLYLNKNSQNKMGKFLQKKFRKIYSKFEINFDQNSELKISKNTKYIRKHNRNYTTY